MIRQTQEGFKLQTYSDGSESLIVESLKLDACIKYVLEENIKSITINYFQEYQLPEINFLSRLANILEGLHLPESKFDNQIINSLHNLKFLGYADNKKDVIDLNNFPNLEDLACDYTIRLKGLESCRNLKYLTLTGYKSKTKDITDLPLIEQLKELNLFKPDIYTLHGIGQFNKLKKLEIFSASKLETIAALQVLSSSLEEIQVEQCKKIKDYEILGKLLSLKKIILSETGEIKSLAFVKELPQLEFISFWDTNVLDGNIKYCEGINYVGFDNKKHYTHKSEQFKTDVWKF